MGSALKLVRGRGLTNPGAEAERLEGTDASISSTTLKPTVLLRIEAMGFPTFGLLL